MSGGAATTASDPPDRRALLLDELAEGVPQAVLMPDGEPLCLVRDGDRLYAMVDRCPHRDFALSGGELVMPGIIECPWHGARFDCRSGRVVQGPATEGLTLYPVRVADRVVFVGTRPLEQGMRHPDTSAG